MEIDQRRLGGGIASYSPSFGELEESGSIWSDAATIIPWTVYEFYGDKSFLSRHLPMMRSYVDLLIRKDDESGGERLNRFGFCLGGLAEPGRRQQQRACAARPTNTSSPPATTSTVLKFSRMRKGSSGTVSVRSGMRASRRR